MEPLRAGCVMPAADNACLQSGIQDVEVGFLPVAGRAPAAIPLVIAC